MLRVRRVLRRRRLARRLGLVPAQKPIDVTSFVASTAPPDVLVELGAIYRIVDDLPTDERVALVLRRVDGLPLDEVARLSGCSLATAKRRIRAAEERLAEHERDTEPQTTLSAEGKRDERSESRTRGIPASPSTSCTT